MTTTPSTQPLADTELPSLEASPAAIRVTHASMFYGSTRAVANVSMTIYSHAVTALIGPSGCGKSTFLRALNRMHEVVPGARVEGTIEVGGTNIYDPHLDPVLVRRHVGMVFQKANPFPTMSIADNVLAGLKLHAKRIPKRERERILEESLTATHLWDEVKDRLGEPGLALSGGQQQRLCIARAIAVKPTVLLMDEPCSALDPISTLAVEKLMRELAREYTIVIVTHNMQQARRVATDTAFFSISEPGQPGRLVEYGPTAKIFDHPDDEATANYVAGRFG